MPLFYYSGASSQGDSTGLGETVSNLSMPGIEGRAVGEDGETEANMVARLCQRERRTSRPLVSTLSGTDSSLKLNGNDSIKAELTESGGGMDRIIIYVGAEKEGLALELEAESAPLEFRFRNSSTSDAKACAGNLEVP